jgi:hypothetical protein
VCNFYHQLLEREAQVSKKEAIKKGIGNGLAQFSLSISFGGLMLVAAWL